MAKITKEMLHRELLVLESQLTCVEAIADGNLKLLKSINSDLAKGRARIEATKQRCGFATSSVAGVEDRRP